MEFLDLSMAERGPCSTRPTTCDLILSESVSDFVGLPNLVSVNSCWLVQVCSLVAELASAAAAEKGIAFEDGMDDRLCAYSLAVAHFPNGSKGVQVEKWLALFTFRKGNCRRETRSVSATHSMARRT
ncbi:hypothetical protein Acr_19g0008510 [Actinidia rufa]|uniref:Uncharacterized protein n=1 Tax=Actinidia rufa TaxID=165716 RepID=A0A7J0GAT9_9ERIC|nr:hypothetical protein Acr_19g0008510 [Actinidia rufa]